ncbi:hypothetical protein ACQPZK_28105 [Micromonospora sp. CA-249363]|uniref:hypothetical protein n=1 Tax=Micromonospora sp. CA-249363 TaxID=3239963 RepID=UPI003D90FE17
METTKRKDPGLLGFTRRYVLPRLGDVVSHRNVSISLLLAGALVFTSFRLGWFPALKEAEVKDFVAGSLAFSALGFGAATAATVLALSMPRSRLYLTMIVNGKGAPRARIASGAGQELVEAVDEPLFDAEKYGRNFRSYYGDLIFVFLWTMAAQLFMGIMGLVYFAIAGDLKIVDDEQCHRSRVGLFLVVFATSYAVMQLGSLIKALADYAASQEQYDRVRLLAPQQSSDE